MLAHDYLEHKDLYTTLKAILLQEKAEREGPLSLADLGCGDSDYICRIMSEAGGAAVVSRYTGVDLSEPALEISRRNVARSADILCPLHAPGCPKL